MGDTGELLKLGLYCTSSQVFNKRYVYGNKRKRRLMIRADYKPSSEGSQLRFLDVGAKASVIVECL